MEPILSLVFGGIGDTVRLLDVKRWVSSISGLPYQIPTIVKVEADQLIKDLNLPKGEKVHAQACAQPASVYDRTFQRIGCYWSIFFAWNRHRSKEIAKEARLGASARATIRLC